jgi:hypothetical protein
MANITRIKNNQITDATITYAKIASGTLTGALFNPSLTLSSNVTILGNLSVTGNTSTINSTNTYVNDPLIVFNNGYTGSPTYDIGMINNRNLQNLAGYGSVNTGFVWRESDATFVAVATTETGITTGSINITGWANLRAGNTVAISSNIYGTTTSTSITTGALIVGGGAGIGGNVYASGLGQFPGGLQATPIGNVTASTAVFTSANVGGFQANAIGNVNPGTAVFTTANAVSIQSQAIGNITPGTGAFTTGIFSGTVGVTGNLTTGYIISNVGSTSLTIAGNAITSNTGKIGLGNVSNVQITGGTAGYTIVTDGAGNLSFASLLGNSIQLGANASGYLVSNAVTLTTSTTVTDAVSQLNYILGKLVPPSPPAFPGATALTLSTATTSARITNFSQTDNALGNTYQAAAGTTVAAIRTSTYQTSNITDVGLGDSGTVTVYWNGQAAGANTLVAGGNVSTGNLRIGRNMDYNSVNSAVNANFWRIFTTYATGTALPGWNTVLINDTYNGANTNPVLFYYDNTTVAGPTFSNVTTAGTNAVLATNNVSYSSTIPHLTTSSVLRIKGNVANLSGDMYYTSDTFMTGSAGGAWQAPTSVAYSGLTPAPATPLVRNLYASSGSAYFETPSTLVSSGFGSSSTGPSMTAYNGYSSTSQAFTTALGVTVLYKIGTSTQIEETSIPVNSVGTGSGNGYRVANPGSTNNPTYTGTEAAFNSTTGPFGTADCINIGSGSQGILTWSQTNYSTGYYPVGPNLSGQAATQYFTMRFVRTAVSKFDIKYTGTIAGLWVAMPGGSPNGTDTYASTTNGWLDVSTAYAGSGIPGAGTGGNGSAGCAVGGVAVLNSAQTNKSVTATFGTLSSTNATNNYIYVRVALTSGQSLTALTMETATH